jgi:hypothetical protein
VKRSPPTVPPVPPPPPPCSCWAPPWLLHAVTAAASAAVRASLRTNFDVLLIERFLSVPAMISRTFQRQYVELR